MSQLGFDRNAFEVSTGLQFGMGGHWRLALSLADPGRPLVSGSRLRRRHP